MCANVRGKEAERRLLTILVVDIVDSTSLARRLDQEDLAELLNTFHDICGRVIARFGGRVAKDLGDGLSAHFGWPESHEREAERAVLAALELLDAMKTIHSRTSHEIRLHIGIATGEAVVGDVQRGPSWRIHEAFGELPSLAARIQTASPPNTILISTGTYHLVRYKFVCVNAGRKRLKGFGKPVELYRVMAPRGLPLDFDGRRASGLSPFIGRASELDCLNVLWRQAAAGNGGLVLLTGEPGIGKSRLCAEFQMSLDQGSLSSFCFQCSPLHKNAPLYPVTRSVAQVAGLSDDDPPERKLQKLEIAFRDIGLGRPEALDLLATHLGAVKETDIGQELPTAERLRRRRRSLNSLLINFILTFARQRTLLIVVEDLHWMDPTTAEFVELLAERLRGHSILAIFTSRPQTSCYLENAHLLSLDRLTRDETIQLIGMFAASPRLSNELISQLVEISDGNPLYIEELTAAVISGHRIATSTPRREGQSDVPATLQESLLARIDRVSMQARELIQLCAVLGRRFSYKGISAVADVDDSQLKRTLDELVGEGLLYSNLQSADEVEYCFKHALIQATAYSIILREKRRRLHLKCATALEANVPSIREQDPGVLGLHYENAGDAQAALPYILAAAKSSIERSALLEATSYLDRGLLLLQSLPESPARDSYELMFRSALGRVCIFGKGWADSSVKEHYERALQLVKQVGGIREQIPIEWALTTYHLLRGEMHRAVSGGRQVLGLAEIVNDQDFLLVAHSALSIYEFYSGNFIGAVGHKDQALRFYRGATGEELRKAFGTDRRLQAIRGAALSHWCLGNHKVAIELDEEQRSSAVHHPFDYTYSLTISCILHSLGRNSQLMRKFAEQAISLAQEQGFWFLEANAANFRAIAKMLEDPGEEALRDFDETIRKYQAGANQMGISSMFAIIAEQCGKIGLVDRGLQYADHALAYVRRSGERFAKSDLYRVKGMLLSSRNSTREAQRYLVRALLIAREQRAKSWEFGAAIPLAEIFFAEGQFKKANELLWPLCDELGGSESVSEQLVQAQDLLGRCGARN